MVGYGFSTEHLARRCWTEPLKLECHGTCIAIQTDLPEARSGLVRYLPPGWRRTEGTATTWCFLHRDATDGLYWLRVGSHEVVRTESLEEMLEQLESMLEFEVAQGAPHRLFVHAGAVGWRGRALVLPGRSRSGKTSLVEALVRAGATYFSDEYAVLDDQGAVHPFPRALSIRVAGSTKPRQQTAAELGGRVADGPLQLGLIVVTRYRPATEWQPHRLAAAEALLALLANTVVARLRPSFTLDILETAVVGAPALGGDRGEATAAAARLLELMEQTLLPAPAQQRSS